MDTPNDEEIKMDEEYTTNNNTNNTVSNTNNNSNKISTNVDNRDDEFGLPNDDAKDSNKNKEKLVTRTRSRRISRSYNCFLRWCTYKKKMKDGLHYIILMVWI